MSHIQFPQGYPLDSAIIASLIYLIVLLPPVLIFLHKKILAASSAKKIAALPAASLPTIRILPNAASRQNDIMARVNEKINER